ncbi:hypothetical protein [Nocardia sp. R7R-8]|uniref:hypothetical protein n=1 Tax=Nocardia sp. R7R-8 TaxID=3459304 RepID=UPI00403D8319
MGSSIIQQFDCFGLTLHPATIQSYGHNIIRVARIAVEIGKEYAASNRPWMVRIRRLIIKYPLVLIALHETVHSSSFQGFRPLPTIHRHAACSALPVFVREYLSPSHCLSARDDQAFSSCPCSAPPAKGSNLRQSATHDQWFSLVQHVCVVVTSPPEITTHTVATIPSSNRHTREPRQVGPDLGPVDVVDLGTSRVLRSVPGARSGSSTA